MESQINTTIQASSYIAKHLCNAHDFLFEHTSTIFSSIEAAFYDRATAFPKHIDDLIARLAIRQFDYIQRVFTTVSGIAALSSVKQIADSLNGPALESLYNTRLGSFLPRAGLALLLFGSCYALISHNMDENSKSKSQVIAGTIQLATIITSLALALLTEHRISMVLRAAFNTYSLWRNDEVTWTSGNTAPDIDDGLKVSTRKGFEKVYALYNTFQAGLSLLQGVPELAPSIATLKAVLIVPDVVMGGFAHYYLNKSMKKLGSNNSEFLVLQTALAAIPVFFGFQAIFGRKESLDGLTSGNVTARWSLPIIEQIRGWVDSYRLITTAGLIYFSTHKKLNLLSLITQAVGLRGIVSRPWIQISQEYENVTLHTYALLPSIDDISLRLAIEKIAEIQRTIITNGSRLIIAHYNNGTFTHYTIRIIYRLPKISDIREYAWTPWIYSMGGTAYDPHYGWLAAEVQW